MYLHQLYSLIIVTSLIIINDGYTRIIFDKQIKDILRIAYLHEGVIIQLRGCQMYKNFAPADTTQTNSMSSVNLMHQSV